MDGASGAPANAPTSVAMSLPAATLSPRFSSTRAMTPAALEGTSMVALSLSSVASGVSASTRSPGFTSTSSTVTSCVPPRSGMRSTVSSALGSVGPDKRRHSVSRRSPQGIACSSPCTSASARARKPVKRTASAPSITR